MVIEKDGIISFSGSLSNDLRGALVCLHRLTSEHSVKTIILDFSAATYANVSMMLPFCSQCCFYRSNSIDFVLILPNDATLRRLFVNANWANLIHPSAFQRNFNRRSNNLPALQFSDGDEQFNVVNKALDILMETISIQDRKQIKALEWALNEITDNVINHSESVSGGLLQIQCFPARNSITFAVADAGLGIATTLRNANKSITSDTDALDRAIREGVTRNTATNQGNGLYGTFMCCEVSGGSFTLQSGNASLLFKQGRLTAKRDNVPFRGSLVLATINYTVPNLLERALVFKGKTHVPDHDYIDSHFAKIGDQTVFRFVSEVEGFGSREYGRRAKNKIDNIMVDKSSSIVLDLIDIPVLSSSFADEVFGRLFTELGPIEFIRRCNFANVDPTVQRLIDRAITQRMRT